MRRSQNWENERYLFEKLKQTDIFRYWKRIQFDCQVGRCAYCGKPMQYRYAETDHIKPLYYGGTSEADNLVLCHHACNKSKSTNTKFSRPNWIEANRYSVAATGKYHALKKSLYENDYIKTKREQTINPTSRQSKSKAGRGAVFGVVAFIYLIVATIIAFYSWSNKHDASHAPSSVGVSTKTTSNTATSATDARNTATSTTNTEDEKLKEYAQSILASYTNYYNNYVNKPSAVASSLPSDSYNCHSFGDGCIMSMYAKASLPNGYTYSVNSLENNTTFHQNGTIPHATPTNVALYKKARCGEGDAVIGGSENKHAASVIQLSDGTYYCVEN